MQHWWQVKAAPCCFGEKLTEVSEVAENVKHFATI